MAIKGTVCDVCGKSTKEITKYGNDSFCKICFKTYFHKCSNCGRVKPKACMYVLDEDFICVECLSGKNAKYQRCDDCGKLTKKSTKEKFIHIEELKKTVCKTCFNKKYKVCDVCGRTVDKMRNQRQHIDTHYLDTHRKDIFNGEGLFACSGKCAGILLKKGKVQCKHDKLFYNKEDCIKVDLGFLCKKCGESHTVTCEHCGKFGYKGTIVFEKVKNDDGTITKMCKNCFDKSYMKCVNCGNVIKRDPEDKRDPESILCLDCLLKHPVRSYNHRPSPIFLKVKGEEDSFMGIEIEVSMKGKSTWKSSERDRLAASLIKDFPDCFDSKMYIKFDRSVGSDGNGGFEIVTHPMTYRYIRTKSRIKEILEWLEDKVYLDGGGRCGIHIHIDKRQYKQRADNSHIRENKMFINKLCMFFYCNFDKISKFSNRKKEQIDRWCRPFTKLETISLFRGELRYDRHSAFNTKPPNTIEIRIFNGDIKYNTFIKYVRFTSMLISFLKYYKRSFFDREFKNSKDKENRYTWKTFVEFTRFRNSHLYKELIEI